MNVCSVAEEFYLLKIAAQREKSKIHVVILSKENKQSSYVKYLRQEMLHVTSSFLLEEVFFPSSYHFFKWLLSKKDK